ncbi:DUF4426 domain-containing protein [Psychromonas antarctica]|uniref:DUF4426 domain-containing protein n=1 Tax=Psychromonas antarctica TaxID=67573 RepID=UPI001EE7EEE4|nr:DUF4426 domain-containing protein [Psychromonas antarctica]MCG6200773.1 DUF4426 domain-containing protein [Psychromonas antarctica]
MMRTLSRLIAATMLFSFSQLTTAEQLQEFDNLQVHYIALPSTFLQPDIANQYAIKRSKYTGIINIAVIDKNNQLNAVKSQISGSGKNLLGQTEILDFREIIEGKAIYYMAIYPFTNEEIVNFSIKINSQNKTNILKFQHKFYVD